jgi:type VI secretion system protein ImpC
VQREVGARQSGPRDAAGSTRWRGRPRQRTSGGSDDIGDISWVVPTVTLRFPSNIPGLPGHHWSNAIAMATPIAHKGATAGAKVMARTALEFFLTPRLVEESWNYFRDVQTKDRQYMPFITADDPPPIWLNTRIMQEFAAAAAAVPLRRDAVRHLPRAARHPLPDAEAVMSAHDRYRVHLDAGGDSAHARPLRDDAFSILVAGDFSGAGRDAARQAAVRQVDRDNLDEVLAALQPAVRLRPANDGPEMTVTFSSLDDFHPDELLRRVPLLQALRETRRRISAGDVAREPPAQAPQVSGTGEAGGAAAGSGGGASTGGAGGLLDQILDAQPSAKPSPRIAEPDPADLHAYIRAAVQPHLVAEPDVRQDALLAQVDEKTTELLRALLHDASFQALEAAWRGLALLVRRLETGSHLKVSLLDVSREQLAAAADDPGGSTLFQALQQARDAGTPHALVAALFTFTASDDDAILLHALGGIAQTVGATFIGAAAPSLAGLDSFEHEPDARDIAASSSTVWDLVRSGAEGTAVCLAAPRFLLRAPYDPREEPCETISLTEMEASQVHEHYLWGSPALAVALVLGEAFERDGWDLRRDGGGVITGLPMHYYREAGATTAKPCAETLIGDRTAARIAECGIVPLLSQKDGDAVLIPGVWPLAEPGAAAG